jgi:hypothetical protein
VDPIDAMCDKYLNDPLVVEIMEKYKELEKQPGYEFQDKPLSQIIPELSQGGGLKAKKIPPSKPLAINQAFKIPDTRKADQGLDPMAEDTPLKRINDIMYNFASQMESEELEYQQKLEIKNGGDKVKLAKAKIEAQIPFFHDEFEEVRKERVKKISKDKKVAPRPMGYGAGVVSSKAEGSQNLGGGFNSKQFQDGKFKVQRQGGAEDKP